MGEHTGGPETRGDSGTDAGERGRMTNPRRVSCVGYGRPCPNHAWWYHERPGPPRKRCAFCHERRRWLEAEHAASCVDCGAPLSQPATGRPRLRCEECSPRQPQHISTVLGRALSDVAEKAG